jgi:hypothetical protein
MLFQLRGLKLKKNIRYLLSCKRTNNCGTTIIKFLLYGHFLCSTILLQKSITIPLRAWGAYCATPWLQVLIVVTQHDRKKAFFFTILHMASLWKNMLITNMGLLWIDRKNLLMKVLMGLGLGFKVEKEKEENNASQLHWLFFWSEPLQTNWPRSTNVYWRSGFVDYKGVPTIVCNWKTLLWHLVMFYESIFWSCCLRWWKCMCSHQSQNVLWPLLRSIFACPKLELIHLIFPSISWLGTSPCYNKHVWNFKHLRNNLSKANEVSIGYISIHKQGDCLC